MKLPPWRISIEVIMPLMHAEASELAPSIINRVSHGLTKAVLMMQGPLWRTNAHRDGDLSESGLAEQVRVTVGESTIGDAGSNVASRLHKVAHLEAVGKPINRPINRILRNGDSLWQNHFEHFGASPLLGAGRSLSLNQRRIKPKLN